MTRVVSVSGLDGCGKTTIIEALRQEFEARGMPASYIWLRYNHYFTRLLHGFCRLIGYTKYENHNDMKIGYHEFHHSQLISWVAIMLNLVDTFLATLIYVYLPLLFTRRIILCDRWVFDIIVDMAVDTRKELTPLPWWGNAFLWLVPQSARCFLIQRNRKALEEARPENIFDRNYLLRRQMFDALAIHNHLVEISNDRTIQEAVHDILNYLSLPYVCRRKRAQNCSN